MAAEVNVAAEGAYTETGLVVEVYAGTATAILSYGIKLTYDAEQLEVSGAEKNETVWFMGDGTPSGNSAYMNPDTSVPGEVVIIGGKLDTAAPAAGVSGQRILLGRVFFNRTDSSMPFAPTLAIDLARTSPYANFVSTAGQILDGDGVGFSMKVVERGDCNGDGSITPADIMAVKSRIGSANAPCYVDCNNDGAVTPQDINCVKRKIH
ncbi:MAG: dockerin type I domain-containing protein [Thermodesulfobacteriota bacterium]